MDDSTAAVIYCGGESLFSPGKWNLLLFCMVGEYHQRMPLPFIGFIRLIRSQLPHVTAASTDLQF